MPYKIAPLPTMPTQGEYYDRISDIVSEDEAWEMIYETCSFSESVAETEQFLSDIIENERGRGHRLLLNADQMAEAEDQTKIAWRKDGINTNPGYHIRKDGMVEVKSYEL